MAIKQRKQITGTTAQINSFAGHEGVLAFDKATKHLHVLSGTAGTTTKLANMSDIPNISGKADKTYVDQQLATKEAKGTAYTKAESDGKYSTKTDSDSKYATKAEVTQGLAGKAPNDHTHTKSQITDFPTIPDTSGLIPKIGNRGSLKGFEGSAKGTTVNDMSPDTQHTNSNVTVQNGTDNATASWTKVVDMTAGTVTLGSNWVWSGGKAPTLKYPGVLTCHWNGGNNKGIAVYTAGAS